MSAQLLLQHFDRLAQVPGAIPRLRRCILDLAVRGKLTEQDPNDQPAAELLKKIAEEKAKLIKEGTIKKGKELPPISAEELPFELPEGWEWVRIGGGTYQIDYGTSVKSDHMTIGVPVLKMGDIQNGQIILGRQKKVPETIEDLPHLFLKKFDLLYNRTNSAELVGKTGIYLGQDNSYTFASYLIRMRFFNELINPIFVNIAMNAPYFRETQITPQLQQQCGQANVNGTKLRNMLIPLPPLAEQKRIVEKVDQLMALCDQLESVQGEREEQRAALAAAALHRLNTAQGKEFRANARFYFEHLPLLTTQIEQVRKLRETILNLAVRGKLTEQDPNDQPAAELLKKIAEEKAKLIKEGTIKKGKELPPISAEEFPFELPEGWEPAHLAEISNIVMGQSPPGSTYNTVGDGIPLINGPVEFTAGPFGRTKINQYTTAPTNLCNEGDLLLCVRGSTTGRTNIAAFQACIGRGVAAIQSMFSDQYVRLFIWSMRESIIAMGRGIAFPSITRQQIEELLVPLPPLAEQKRIVEKVDQLMALCDQLEQNIRETEERGRGLLEATLHGVHS